MQPTNWLNKFIWLHIKPNSLKKIRDVAYKLIEWVYLTTYQAELIVEGSWCSLQTDWMSLSDDLSNQTH